MNDARPRYRRILLKLSGEALMGGQSFGIDPSVLETVASEISDIHKLGVEVGIVIGGGNIFRGLQSDAFGVERVAGDHMGMLATVINAIALGEVLKKIGLESRVMSALDISRVAESYDRGQAIKSPFQKTHRHLWRRHREPLFHHRYRRGPQGTGNRCGSPYEGNQRGWRL